MINNVCLRDFLSSVIIQIYMLYLGRYDISKGPFTHVRAVAQTVFKNVLPY